MLPCFLLIQSQLAVARTTSVEQALHPELLGRPVVTGQERGIIACASYEAKALGIKRGVALHEARRMCPDLVVLPSDYETYSLFSKRMFDIARRYTPTVEEYSIDEGFADLTGLRRVFHASYEDIARQLQQAIGAELGMTVSVGLSLSKGLAKLCSKYRKPRGLTAVAGYHIHLLLQKTPLEKVWGFGPNTVALLTKLGLRTAYDFAIRSKAWAEKLLGKIGRELWGELRGEAVYPVTTEEKSMYFTVSKCKTFTAPSAEREFVLAKLLRNLESGCIKLRRHQLRARSLLVSLRKKEYSQDTVEARLDRWTSVTRELGPVVTQLFEQLYHAGAEYRATVIILGRLESDRERQRELFEGQPAHRETGGGLGRDRCGEQGVRQAQALPRNGAIPGPAPAHGPGPPALAEDQPARGRDGMTAPQGHTAGRDDLNIPLTCERYRWRCAGMRVQVRDSRT